MILVGKDPITIWIENGELKLSTIIRSEDGNVIAKIEANEWQVNPNQIFDRNFDDRALEVINQKDEGVLQAEFDGNTVHFCAKLYRDDGWQITMGNNYMEIRPPNATVELNFPRIFKYPSLEFPGQRV